MKDRMIYGSTCGAKLRHEQECGDGERYISEMAVGEGLSV